MTNNQQDLNQQPSVTFSKVAKKLFDVSSMRTKTYVTGATASGVLAAKELVDFQVAFSERILDWVNGAETVAHSNLGVSGSLSVGFAVAAGLLARQIRPSFSQDVVEEAVNRAQTQKLQR